MGVSPLHWFIVASLKINQIYIKRDKIKIKPYLYTITIPLAKFPYSLTASIYKISLILINVISCILIRFAWSAMGYRNQYFMYLWRHSCLSLRIHHGRSCTKPSNCSDKIKMPKSTTGCWIKSFIPVENMNVAKLRDIYCNLNYSSQVSLRLT